MSEERGRAGPGARFGCGSVGGGVEDDVAGCEETIHRLYFFLDGELTDERRRAIAAHLDLCGDCLDAVDFEAELRRVIADRCKDRVPDSLRERIAEALHQEQVASGEG